MDEEPQDIIGTATFPVVPPRSGRRLRSASRADLRKVQCVVASCSVRFPKDPEAPTAQSEDGDTAEPATGATAAPGAGAAVKVEDTVDIDERQDLPMNSMVATRLTSFNRVRVDWDLLRQEEKSASGKDVQLIKRPTASHMTYLALHAAVYRYLEPMYTLDQVAEHLGVNDWRAEVARLWPRFETQFRAFCALPNGMPETEIREALNALIVMLSDNLGRRCLPDPRRSTTVRGTLAADEFAVRGVSDIVVGSGERPILAAEVKTNTSWLARHHWYRGSRGVQLLNTLYAHGCPTLLVTPRRFKLFVENGARDRVHSYPCWEIAPDASDHEKFWASLSWKSTGDMLFNVIVICLLKAPRTHAAPIYPAPTAAAAATSEQRDPPAQEFNASKWLPASDTTPLKPARSSRTPAAGSSSSATQRSLEPVNPQFFTGEFDASGNRIYRTVVVTVAPLDQVAEFEPDGSERQVESSSGEEKMLTRLDSGIAL